MWKKPYADGDAAEISEDEDANMAAAGTMQHNPVLQTNSFG